MPFPTQTPIFSRPAVPAQPAAVAPPPMPPRVAPMPITPGVIPQYQPTMQDRIANTLQRDPSISLALLNAGINMLQPTPPGQTHIGHIAQGIGAGMNTYIANRERLDRNADEDKRMKLLENADTRAEAKAGREAELFPEEKKAVQRQSELADLGINEKKFEQKLRDKYGDEQAKLTMDAIRARIRASDASASAYGAKAKAYDRGDLAAGGATSGPIQELEWLTNTYKLINPGATEAEARSAAKTQYYAGKSDPDKAIGTVDAQIIAVVDSLTMDPKEKATLLEELRARKAGLQQRMPQAGMRPEGESSGVQAGSVNRTPRKDYNLIIQELETEARTYNQDPNDPQIRQRLLNEAARRFSAPENQL